MLIVDQALHHANFGFNIALNYIIGAHAVIYIIWSL